MGELGVLKVVHKPVECKEVGIYLVECKEGLDRLDKRQLCQLSDVRLLVEPLGREVES